MWEVEGKEAGSKNSEQDSERTRKVKKVKKKRLFYKFMREGNRISKFNP